MLKDNTIYLGIDPGQKGGLSITQGDEVACTPIPEEESRIWEWIQKAKNLSLSEKCDIMATLEQQLPRPTSFFRKGTGSFESSILRSTCILYGHYMLLKGFLIASGIRILEVLPQEWQKEFDLPKKKEVGDSKWKGILKSKSQELFPSKKNITLKVSDSLLICEYGRRRSNFLKSSKRL